MTTTAPSGTPDARVHGALALELVPGSDAALDALPQDRAGALATRVARDLAGHHAEAARLELVTVAAHYDPVELLRPGWPLHEALHQLATRAPRVSSPSPTRGGGLGWGTAGAGTHPHPDLPPHAGEGEDPGRIIAFGTHAGRLPRALAPSPEFRGGPLRLVPFSLAGEADIRARVSEAFEADLMERGMAAPDTALAMQEAFGLRIEHARYLTLHDLAAMTALQYEHSGLAPLWPVLEAALFAPGREVSIDSPSEPLVHYQAREARIVMFSAEDWRRHHGKDADSAEPRLARALARFEARQRQFAHVLRAHGVVTAFEYCENREIAAKPREAEP
jgi:hypothetical protein